MSSAWLSGSAFCFEFLADDSSTTFFWCMPLHPVFPSQLCSGFLKCFSGRQHNILTLFLNFAVLIDIWGFRYINMIRAFQMTYWTSLILFLSVYVCMYMHMYMFMGVSAGASTHSVYVSQKTILGVNLQMTSFLFVPSIDSHWLDLYHIARLSGL